MKPCWPGWRGAFRAGQNGAVDCFLLMCCLCRPGLARRSAYELRVVVTKILRDRRIACEDRSMLYRHGLKNVTDARWIRALSGAAADRATDQACLCERRSSHLVWLLCFHCQHGFVVGYAEDRVPTAFAGREGGWPVLIVRRAVVMQRCRSKRCSEAKERVESNLR